jgi:hypothetical protein
LEGAGQADRHRPERVTDLPVGSSVVPFEAGTASAVILGAGSGSGRHQS